MVTAASRHPVPVPVDVSATVRSVYDAITSRNTVPLEEMLAPDVQVLTPESDGAHSGAEATAAYVRGLLVDAGEGPIRLQSTDLRVGTTASGLDAWVSDQILMDRGPAEPTRLRMTALLCRDDSQWRVSAGHCSIPLSNDHTRALVEAGKLPAGVALSETVAGNAQELVELLDECLANPARFSEVCSTRADTVAFGSAVEEVFYGPQVKEAWDQFVGYGPKMVRRGGVAAGVSASGELGWVGTHIDISFDITRPYRFFIVYVRANGHWEMVSIHDSVSSISLSAE
jgi:ketosteroid isomerase-like protein